MAQNLSYIERELLRVEKAAFQTTEQMRLLEQAMANVVIQASKGSGAASLSTQGAGVQNVAGRALASPYMNPSGSPVGGRAIVGSDVDMAKVQGIAKEYQRHKDSLVSLTTQLDLLHKAEVANANAVIAKTEATRKAAINDEVNAELAAKRLATEQAAEAAEVKGTLTLKQRIDAYSAEIKATKELAEAEKTATKKLGELTAGVDTAASEIAAKTKGGKRGKGAEREIYTQARLEGILAKTPGAAKAISATAAKSDFTPQDIKDVTEYANAYTQVRYAVRSADGMMRKMVLTTDKAGNVFTSTQKQFRTFFSAIRRNVTEMIKWSAATLVVWGAIRKLGELLEIAIDNETKLASIAVILGEEHTNLTEVFNSAAEAAAATGESIDGVLEGYVQAYRATGNIADQTERARQAQVLLTDALTLSKLSSMSTAQAMDTLTGALRQAGLGFEEGYVLLDKWVAVSRKANVSIETLAESFAITATSASNAGLTWDELNGIIATLAESTTLSATESGNAIRAFIGGFSTDLAVKELSKYGIAVEDSTGETRGFLDVMKEISAMFEQGIITESELNKISRAIGGRGARRGAQVATTIKNLGRAQEVAEESAKAHGDAQKALNIQLDTVQTAITKLGNSFQKLARAMGSEGGVLDVAGGVLNIFTKMVDATAALTKNLGDMTPILAAIGVLFAVTTSQSRGLLATNLAAGVGGFLNRATGARGGMTIGEQRLQAGTAGGWVATGGPQTQGLGTRAQNRLLGPGLGRNAGTMLGQGLAAGFTAVSAIRDLQQGNRAGAAGSIAGGIIGGLISGGHPIGIVIGTAAGEAFANSMVNYKTEFSNFFDDIFDEILPDVITEPPGGEEAATEALFAQVGLGSEAFGKFITKWAAEGMNIGYQGQQVIGNVTGGLGIGQNWQYKARLPGAQVDPQDVALWAGRGTPEAGEIFNVQARREALRGFEAERQPGAFQYEMIDEQKKLLEEHYDYLTGLKAVQSELVREAALSGDMTGKALKDSLDLIPVMQSVLTKYEVAFGDALREVDSSITNVTDSFDFWTNILVHGTAEQRIELTALATDIAAVGNAIEQAKDLGDTMVTLGFDIEGTEIDESRRVSYEQAAAEEQQLKEDAAIKAIALTKAITRERIVLPTVLDLDIEEADVDLLIAEMEKIRDQTFEGWWAQGLATDWSSAQIAETFAPFFLALGKDGAGKYLEGFDQGFATEAFANLVKRGEIVPTKEDEKIGLQQLDIPSGEFPAVMAEYQSLVQSIQGQLSAQGVEWTPNEESFAALFTDYIAMPITADLTLLNIAMQELIDVSKDQLDGIYNLPTDASFYVPFSGYGLGFVNQGGGGTGGDLAGYMAGITDEAEEERAPAGRRERPEGYIPASVRGRLARARARAQEEEEPTFAGHRGFAGHREAQRPMEPLPAIQLPGLGEIFKMLPGMRSGIEAMENMLEVFRAQGTPAVTPTPGGGPAKLLNELGDLLRGLFGANGEEPTITTKLQIESTTTTIVQLDGQVIANAIKPYLLNDEIRYEGTAGAAVKRFVI